MFNINTLFSMLAFFTLALTTLGCSTEGMAARSAMKNSEGGRVYYTPGPPPDLIISDFNDLRFEKSIESIRSSGAKELSIKESVLSFESMALISSVKSLTTVRFLGDIVSPSILLGLAESDTIDRIVVSPGVLSDSEISELETAMPSVRIQESIASW